MKKWAALCFVLLFAVLFTPLRASAFPGYVMNDSLETCSVDCVHYGLHDKQTEYSDGGSDVYIDLALRLHVKKNAPGTPNYYVVQYEKKIKDFITLNDAIQYAKKWHASRVFAYGTCDLKWDNRPANVFQNNHYLGTFASTKGAIDYAKRWDHARVVDNETQKNVWNNYPNLVYQNNGTLLKQVPQLIDAVNYAKKYQDSFIIDGLDKKLIWCNPGIPSISAGFVRS